MKNCIDEIYPYAYGDRFTKNRNTYFYTEFHGREFFSAWREVRSLASDSEDVCDLGIFKTKSNHSLSHFSDILQNGRVIVTSKLLDTIYVELLDETNEDEVELDVWLKRLIKKFEVCKRIHEKYVGNSFLAVDKDKHKDLILYIKLAYIFSHYYDKRSYMPALNSFLKVMDSLNSHDCITEASFRAHFNKLHKYEIRFITNVAQKCGLIL